MIRLLAHPLPPLPSATGLSKEVGSLFCRIFLHKLVVAPENVARTLLEIFLCSSRYLVHLIQQKENCRRDSLSLIHTANVFSLASLFFAIPTVQYCVYVNAHICNCPSNSFSRTNTPPHPTHLPPTIQHNC
jgi:hypothetical protein